MLKPTKETLDLLQKAYDHFNKELFKTSLPQVMLTLAPSKRSRGHFANNRWGERNADGEVKNVIHEINLNPTAPITRKPVEYLSTLVHEMTHLQQQLEGTPSRGGYHNKQWGGYMELVGLMPSNTGKEDGKKTGQQMTHYVISGGNFEKAFNKLPEGFAVKLGRVENSLKPNAKKDASKVKFTCPSCEANAWGKASLNIGCVDCGVNMLAL